MNAAVATLELTTTAAALTGGEYAPNCAPGRVAGLAGDRVDRFGALYQRARLWKRRMHRVIAEAVASGNVTAAQQGIARYGRAATWETRFYAQYVRAVLAEHG